MIHAFPKKKKRVNQKLTYKKCKSEDKKEE